MTVGALTLFLSVAPASGLAQTTDHADLAVLGGAALDAHMPVPNRASHAPERNTVPLLLASPPPPTQPLAFQQSSRNSCGVAALAYLLALTGIDTSSEADLVAEASAWYHNSDGRPPEAGYSLGDLVRLASSRHYALDAARVPVTQLSAIDMPVILRLRMGDDRFHFVVLESIEGYSGWVYDPGLGQRVFMPLASVMSNWVEPSGAGILLMAQTTPNSNDSE